MFYANVLCICGTTMALIGWHDHITFMLIVGIILIVFGGLVGTKCDFDNDSKKSLEESRFTALKHLVQEQSVQLELLQKEIDILKR